MRKTRADASLFLTSGCVDPAPPLLFLSSAPADSLAPRLLVVVVGLLLFDELTEEVKRNTEPGA